MEDTIATEEPAIEPEKKPRASRFKWPKTYYDLVLVCWDDAAGLKHGWTAVEEVLVPQLAISAGFLIRENEDHIMIAQDTDDEGSHNGRTQIPRGMIQEIKLLRKADKKHVSRI